MKKVKLFIITAFILVGTLPFSANCNSSYSKVSEANQQQKRYPKIAAFVAVKWDKLTPIVQIGEKWYELVSVNYQSVKDVIDFCLKEYKTQKLIRKRISEDLLEVMDKMGFPIENTEVDIEVKKLKKKKIISMKGVKLTKENRKFISEFNERFE